ATERRAIRPHVATSDRNRPAQLAVDAAPLAIYGTIARHGAILNGATGRAEIRDAATVAGGLVVVQNTTCNRWVTCLNVNAAAVVGGGVVGDRALIEHRSTRVQEERPAAAAAVCRYVGDQAAVADCRAGAETADRSAVAVGSVCDCEAI